MVCTPLGAPIFIFATTNGCGFRYCVPMDGLGLDLKFTARFALMRMVCHYEYS